MNGLSTFPASLRSEKKPNIKTASLHVLFSFVNTRVRTSAPSLIRLYDLPAGYLFSESIDNLDRGLSCCPFLRTMCFVVDMIVHNFLGQARATYTILLIVVQSAV